MTLAQNSLWGMSSTATQTACQWLRTGDEVFPAMLAAIDTARVSVCLEIFIFASGPLGQRFRETLIRAQLRGARVRVLIDAFGSRGLPGNFWEPLQAVGGEARWFNPAALMRWSLRNHRKLLVCDRQVAFVGGFNIAHEYEGDGVHVGWHDLGLELEGPLAAQLAVSFEAMFARADFRHKRFTRLRRFPVDKSAIWPSEQIFFSEPGRGHNPIKLALRGIPRPRATYGSWWPISCRRGGCGAIWSGSRSGADRAVDFAGKIRRAVVATGRPKPLPPAPDTRRGNL